MFRVTKAKAPSVASSGAPRNAEYVVMALDPVLPNERVLAAGAGITITDGGAGGNVTISAAGFDVEGHIPSLSDDFYTARPYWDGVQAITSGDWQINTGTAKLDGVAASLASTWIRRGIPGDCDLQFKVERGTAAAVGFTLAGNALTAQFWRSAAGLEIRMTGEANVSLAGIGANTMWLRIQWDAHNGDIDFYYKVNDIDLWTLAQSYALKQMGHDKTLSLLAANGGYIQRVVFYDNRTEHENRSTAPGFVPLTDGANIAVPADRGNWLGVTINGNRQLDNPTNPVGDGQRMIVRVTQGAGAPYSLTFDTKYRFCLALPVPTLSLAAGQTDYLGFIYHEAADKWDYISEKFGY